eukprot:771759-Pleurochrysis_carterae.AAC.1
MVHRRAVLYFLLCPITDATLVTTIIAKDLPSRGGDSGFAEQQENASTALAGDDAAAARGGRGRQAEMGSADDATQPQVQHIPTAAELSADQETLAANH